MGTFMSYTVQNGLSMDILNYLKKLEEDLEKMPIHTKMN